MARTSKVSEARKALERELFEVLEAFNQSQIDFICDLKRICELRIAILILKKGCPGFIEERKQMIKRLDRRATRFESIPILVAKWVKLQHKKLLHLSDKALENKIRRMKNSISIYQDQRPNLYHQQRVLLVEGMKLQQTELLNRKDPRKIGQQSAAEADANAIIQKMGSLLTPKQKRQLKVSSRKAASVSGLNA